MSPVVSGVGKLYRLGEGEVLASVHYHILKTSSAYSSSWSGEVTLREEVDIGEGGSFIIELEDGLKGKCRLKKLVNRATTYVPRRFVYRLSGDGPLK